MKIITQEMRYLRILNVTRRAQIRNDTISANELSIQKTAFHELQTTLLTVTKSNYVRNT